MQGWEQKLTSQSWLHERSHFVLLALIALSESKLVPILKEELYGCTARSSLCWPQSALKDHTTPMSSDI